MLLLQRPGDGLGQYPEFSVELSFRHHSPLRSPNLWLPPCYSLNNKTQRNHKLTKTIRRKDAMVYTTGKPTSPDEDKLMVLNPVSACYLSSHKWTPGQLSCKCGPVNEELRQDSISICKNLSLLLKNSSKSGPPKRLVSNGPTTHRAASC